MHTVNFESETISANITCKDEKISREIFEPMVNALMYHASAHIGSYIAPNHKLFNKVTNLRSKFLKDVLIEMAATLENTGTIVPDNIIKQIVGNCKIELEDDDEEAEPWE